VVEGRINGQGPVVRPVLFIDGESVYSESRIPSGTADHVQVEFAVPAGAQPGDLVVVETTLLYRRAWRALAVTKGWSVTPQGGPIEIQVAQTVDAIELVEGGVATAIPVTGPFGTAMLVILLATAAVFVIRRTMT